jgi:hypothetical protein
MFYVKSGDLYYTGEFDRCYPPNPYLGTFDEAIEFKTFISAFAWAESYGLKGSQVLGRDEIPEVDLLKAENSKLRKLLARAKSALDCSLKGHPELEEEISDIL